MLILKIEKKKSFFSHGFNFANWLPVNFSQGFNFLNLTKIHESRENLSRERAIRPKYDLWTLRKNYSSAPKKCSANYRWTHDYRLSPLCYFANLFTPKSCKRVDHRKTLMMDFLVACSFIKKWLQHRCFLVNFAKLSRTSISRNIC